MYVLHRPNQHKGKRANTDAAPTAAPTKDCLQQDYKGGGTAAALQLQSRLKTVMCENFVPELRRCWHVFWWGGKLEGPEKRGSHKVGFILCFLLTATFRLAQILLFNPADIRHASYGLEIMNMAYTTYSATIHAGTTFWTFLLYCLKVCWTACVFTPHFFKYWTGRAQLFYQKSKLIWWWWLLIITSYWNEPEMRTEK